jgi:hypothetical protein
MIYGVSDGAFRREIAIPPMQMTGQQWRFDGSTALIPIALGVPVFLRWTMATDSVQLWGEPTAFRKNAMVASMSSGDRPSVMATGGSRSRRRRWCAYAALERSSVPCRCATRRGVVPTDAKMLTQAMPRDGAFIPPASMAMGIHRLPDGRVLLMHLDVEGTRTGRKVELTSTKWWATIYAADLQTACVDQSVPFTTQEMSRLLFAGDTVMTLSRMADDAGSVRSELQRVRFDLTKCNWSPVAAGEK